MSAKRKSNLKRKFDDVANSKAKVWETITKIDNLRNRARQASVNYYELIRKDRIVWSFFWRFIEMKAQEIVELSQDKNQLENVLFPMLLRPTASGVAAAKRDVDILYEKYARKLTLTA